MCWRAEASEEVSKQLLLLYEFPISSFSCKTRIILDHKGVEWVSVPPPDGYGSDAYRAIIPAGTIPAIDQDGFRLADSEAIAEYVNETVADPPMLPVDARMRARAREISRFHDSRLEPLLRGCFGHVAPQARDMNVVANHFDLFEQRLTHLARMVNPSPLLFGDQLTIADCGFVPSFVLMRKLSDVFDLQLTIPQALADYETALTAHPSVLAHSLAYDTTVDAWIASKFC